MVYLTGSHTWANLVDIGPSDPPPVFDFETYVDWMAKLNHNFMRMWTWELLSWDTKGNSENKPMHTLGPHAVRADRARHSAWTASPSST